MDRLERLTPLLEEFVEKGPPGCACIIVRRGGVVYEKYMGYADRERKKEISPDTIYRLFSNSKPVTCAAALILYERGLYLLSDPVSDYLPEFKDMQVYRSVPDTPSQVSPANGPIRIVDLFTMTSGLCYPGDSSETARRTRDILQDLEQKERDGSKFDIRAMSRALAGIPLAFDPGARWMYGTSHDVLGALIEVLSGKTLGRFMQDEIFDPLGMKDTSFRLPEDKRARLCCLYDLSPDGSLTKNSSMDTHYRPDALLETGGGGLLSTIGDHSRFAQMLGCGGFFQWRADTGAQNGSAHVYKPFETPPARGVQLGHPGRIRVRARRAGDDGSGRWRVQRIPRRVRLERIGRHVGTCGPRGRAVSRLCAADDTESRSASDAATPKRPVRGALIPR